MVVFAVITKDDPALMSIAAGRGITLCRGTGPPARAAGVRGAGVGPHAVTMIAITIEPASNNRFGMRQYPTTVKAPIPAGKRDRELPGDRDSVVAFAAPEQQVLAK